MSSRDFDLSSSLCRYTEGDEGVSRQPTAAAAGGSGNDSDDSDDPLDAFMAGIEVREYCSK